MSYSDLPQVAPYQEDKQVSDHPGGISQSHDNTYHHVHGQNGPPSYPEKQWNPGSSHPQERSRKWSPAALGVIGALVILLIGAIIGGAVGGTVSVNNCNSKVHSLSQNISNCNAAMAADSSSTNSSSNGTSTGAGSNLLPTTGCNETTFDSTYTSTKGYKFLKICNKQSPTQDIVSLLTSTWNTCMEACANYNSINATWPKICEGVVFIPSWTEEQTSIQTGGLWGNCWLKSMLGSPSQWGEPFPPYEMVLSQLTSGPGIENSAAGIQAPT